MFFWVAVRHASCKSTTGSETNRSTVQVWHALWFDNDHVCEIAETEGLGKGKRQRKQVKTFEPEM